MTEDDLRLLIELANVVLDSDDAKAYCRGLNTTCYKLEEAILRCKDFLKGM